MYRALDGDSQARLRLDEVTPLVPALEALGFTRLALVTVGGGGAPEQIWVSREQDAFAEPTWGPKKTPQLAFRTLFADGTIVETSHPRTGALRWVPFWPRAHHPAAGYFYEECDGMPHELWLRHQARVDEHRARGHADLAPHGSPAAFIALARRAVHIARVRTRVAQWFGLLVLTAAAVPITLRKDLFPQWLLPSTAVLWALATWGSYAVMLRLPSPRVRPAAELIARVQDKG